MNYYEELGIHPDATTGEIREAYKLVARLLHPDKQRDPRLKELAECQMKRLGAVLAVLVNPWERARYDQGLADGARPARPEPLAQPAGPELLQTVVRHWFWVLLASTTVAMAAWYGLARGPDAPRSAGADSAGVPPAPAAAPNQPAPVKTQRVKPVRSPRLPSTDTAQTEPEPPAGATAPAPAEPQAEAAKERQRSLPTIQKAPPVAATADRSRGGAEARFAGEWLYAADRPVAGAADAYPARYVEFRLRDEGGILAGDYRALHSVADKAISSEVAFRVRGESAPGNTAKLVWESGAGARGEVELTLRSPDQLQVKWWTTQFGRREALSSGMAVLMRLKTP